MNELSQLELGRKSTYDVYYNPDRLFPIERDDKRRALGVDPNHLPFYGFDLWTHYEVSWLNSKGKPECAIADIAYDCHSEAIIESKSMKLYFNSFNQEKISDWGYLQQTIKNDIAKRIHADVDVRLYGMRDYDGGLLNHQFDGECIDHQDIECSIYEVSPELLTTSESIVNETLYSDLLKSNCLVTGQPDWGSVQIIYKGPKIDRAGLLRYLVSYRNHSGFSEHCIERIFVDIHKQCQPVELTVYGRYTRRGGIDINPCRSTHTVSDVGKPIRLCRQ